MPLKLRSYFSQGGYSNNFLVGMCCTGLKKLVYVMVFGLKTNDFLEQIFATICVFGAEI